MIAINREFWNRLKQGEDLLFHDLLPILGDEKLFEKHINILITDIYKKSLHLFPDLEEEYSGNMKAPRLKSLDPLSIYLHDIKGVKETDREQEYVLARAIELAREVLQKEILSAPHVFDETNRIETALDTSDPILHEFLTQLGNNKTQTQDAEEEFQNKLLRLRQRLNELNNIKSILISRNLHLVPTFARRYRKLGVPYQDLIQEGNTSLIRAADKFDWRKGVRFSSYAQWWIHQALLKTLYCQSRTVRLPVYLNQKMKKIRDANRESLTESGQSLSLEEVSETLNEPVNRIRRALNANVTTISLDQEHEKNGDYALRDILVDEHHFNIEDVPEGPDLKERVSQILQTLPDKERQILMMRYGLSGQKKRTLEEISKIYKVSRERIRQIQVQAIQKLLTPAKKNKLAAFLN